MEYPESEYSEPEYPESDYQEEISYPDCIERVLNLFFFYFRPEYDPEDDSDPIIPDYPEPEYPEEISDPDCIERVQKSIESPMGNNRFSYSFRIKKSS